MSVMQTMIEVVLAFAGAEPGRAGELPRVARAESLAGAL
jgi:hypothetical protein